MKKNDSSPTIAKLNGAFCRLESSGLLMVSVISASKGDRRDDASNLARKSLIVKASSVQTIQQGANSPLVTPTIPLPAEVVILSTNEPVTHPAKASSMAPNTFPESEEGRTLSPKMSTITFPFRVVEKYFTLLKS